MALVQNNAKADKTAFLDFSAPSVSKSADDGEFDKVMQTTKDAPSDVKTEVRQNTDKAGTPNNVKDNVKEKLSNMGTKTQEKLSASEAEENPEKAAELLVTLMADIKELLMQTFDISEGELSNIMEALELTDMDLLNPDAINQLSVKLAGAENPMELLFHSEFTDVLKQLNQDIAGKKQEVFENTGISEKQAVKLVEQLMETDAELAEMTGVRGSGEARKEQDVNLEKLPEHRQTEVEAPKQQTVTVENTASKEMTHEDSDTDRELSQSMGQQLTAADQIMNTVTQAVEEALPEADAGKIVQQLIERARVTVNEDTSSFEMQLNPEHLGKINLQVIAKDGAVTAQITAENAAVKEALESQILILKENLVEQGIQIDAVEVTVASHEFERNLDEHRDKSEEGQGSQKKRFRFDVMEASEEELTQADMIMRDMMLASGNQFNYMA